MRTVNVSWRWAAAAALALLAAGCSSSSGPLTRSGSSPPSAPAPATTSPSALPSRGVQHLTVTPATGLKSGQRVQVRASGFSPGESLVVTECAAKGKSTGPGDCNLTGMQSVTADASGLVRIGFTVSKGPFGSNNIVCGRPRSCLISVTQASPSPTEEADAPISFG